MRVLAFSMLAFLMLALSPASALKVLVMAHRSHTATILPHAQAGGRRVAESEAVRCLSESEAAALCIACLVRFCVSRIERARSILNTQRDPFSLFALRLRPCRVVHGVVGERCRRVCTGVQNDIILIIYFQYNLTITLYGFFTVKPTAQSDAFTRRTACRVRTTVRCPSGRRYSHSSGGLPH